MTRKRVTNGKRRRQRPRDLDSLSDKELLDTRLCDLGVTLDESALRDRIDDLYGELSERGIRFRPRCWLSNDWFSPDGTPGIAIPFYLAHPRLVRLERKQMLDVEGGTKDWCMRILRHEAGHALDTAFRLHRRQGYRRTFGNYFDPYPEYYRPRPGSKSFVVHLEPWYAQSHPAEDFAETFAVWLRPGAEWRNEYRGWKALEKIEFVDQLMLDVAGKRPLIKRRACVEPLSEMRMTLRQHYQQLHERHGVDIADQAIDAHLSKLFAKGRDPRRSLSAVAFLIDQRVRVRRIVAQWTGEYQYNIDQLLARMIRRCRVLGLSIQGDQDDLLQRLISMVTAIAMSQLRGHHYRVAL